VERRVDIGMAKDGSGVGGELFYFLRFLRVLNNFFIYIAALCALQAIKQEQKHRTHPSRNYHAFPSHSQDRP
jgi:hypothetical protein